MYLVHAYGTCTMYNQSSYSSSHFSSSSSTISSSCLQGHSSTCPLLVSPRPSSMRKQLPVDSWSTTSATSVAPTQQDYVWTQATMILWTCGAVAARLVSWLDWLQKPVISHSVACLCDEHIILAVFKYQIQTPLKPTMNSINGALCSVYASVLRSLHCTL